MLRTSNAHHLEIFMHSSETSNVGKISYSWLPADYCSKTFKNTSINNYYLKQVCTTQKVRRAKRININSPRTAKVYFVVQ